MTPPPARHDTEKGAAMESTEEVTDDGQPVVHLADTAPQEREQVLRELVLRRASEILEAAQLDEESSFLENGLNSLSALNLAKTLMNDTGLEVPLVTIVEHPTPALLGAYLAEAYESDADTD